MMSTSDPALISFAAGVLEQQGAAIEREKDHVLALLPPDVAQFLNLPEEAQLGTDGAQLLYGSPVIDSIIRLASRETPILYGMLEIPYLKQEGFEKVLAEDLRIVGAQIKLTGRAETRSTYTILVCHYVALSDERKEGLVEVAINESNGVVLPDLEQQWRRYQAEYVHEDKLPPQFSSLPGGALDPALKRAGEITEALLSDFVQGMKRRLHRDVGNTREYFEALRTEMVESLARPSLTDDQKKERQSKIDRLPEEIEAKIADLEEKYSVKIKLTGRAAVRLLIPTIQLMAKIRYRQMKYPITFTWNPVTRHIEPLLCHRCGTAIRELHPLVQKANMLLVCASCRGKVA